MSKSIKVNKQWEFYLRLNVFISILEKVLGHFPRGNLPPSLNSNPDLNPNLNFNANWEQFSSGLIVRTPVKKNVKLGKFLLYSGIGFLYLFVWWISQIIQ